MGRHEQQSKNWIKCTCSVSSLGTLSPYRQSPAKNKTKHSLFTFFEMESGLAELSVLTRRRRGPRIKTKCWCSFLHFIFSVGTT